MAYQRSFGDSRPVTEPACIHLRSKAMYVSGDRRPVNQVDEAGSHYCWCNITQHVRGPDHGDVDRESCVAGRDCYRDVYDV